jgi:hypothetical protein
VPQKEMGQHRRQHMMVPTGIFVSFIVSHPERFARTSPSAQSICVRACCIGLPYNRNNRRNAHSSSINPSTSLGTGSNVGMAKPSSPLRQAGNIWCLLGIHGIYRRSVPSGCAQVKYKWRCRDMYSKIAPDSAWIWTRS